MDNGEDLPSFDPTGHYISEYLDLLPADAPGDHEVWQKLKLTGTNEAHKLVRVTFREPGLPVLMAQVTVGQSGSAYGALRIGRSMYIMMSQGCGKEEVVHFRNEIYAGIKELEKKKSILIDGTGASPPKRQKVDGDGTEAVKAEVKEEPPSKTKEELACSTDDEVNGIEASSNGGGSQEVSMRSCRGKSAWLLLPRDVLWLDFAEFDKMFEDAGWKCADKGTNHHDFSGDTPLRLYVTGKLLARTGKRDVAEKCRDRYEDMLSKAV